MCAEHRQHDTSTVLELGLYFYTHADSIAVRCRWGYALHTSRLFCFQRLNVCVSGSYTHINLRNPSCDSMCLLSCVSTHCLSAYTNENGTCRTYVSIHACVGVGRFVVCCLRIDVQQSMYDTCSIAMCNILLRFVVVHSCGMYCMLTWFDVLLVLCSVALPRYVMCT